MVPIIYVIYALIPLFITLRAITTIDKRIRNFRCHYAMPSFVLIVVNTVCFYFLWKNNSIYLLNQISPIIPLTTMCLFLVLIFYYMGYKQEKKLLLEIANDIIQKMKT